MTEGLDRRLVAVMFTDMVGYTALLQADERLGVEKRDRYMSALESHHDAFGGTIGVDVDDALLVGVDLRCDETPGREFVDQARAALPADDVARAAEVGRRLTIKEALDLARIPETASV
jgi:class 3 adenylate cyclase